MKEIAVRPVLAAASALLALSWFTIAGFAAAQDAPAATAPPATSAATLPPAPQAPTRSTVYSIHDPAAIHEFVADAGEVHAMVDRLVIAVTGKENIAAAWRSLVAPSDVVGIKISATGQAFGATHRAVVARIVQGLEESGVPRDNIIVWDRDADDLREAGYLERDGKTSNFLCPVLSIPPKYGYDAKDTYSAPYLGKLIWGDLLFQGLPVPADDSLSGPLTSLSNPFTRSGTRSTQPANGGEGPKLRIAPSSPDPNLSSISHYCTIIAHRVTKIIDVPVFTDSGFAGVAGALYNVTIPNVDNWRRLVGPPRYGETAIPEMFSDPQVGGRVVLNITDGLIAQIAGGPQFEPLYARHLATLYASKDAVALDSVVLRYLEIWRAQAQLPPLGDMAAHVHTAADMGIGNAAADRIDLRALNQ